MVIVTSWADEGITPDLQSGRWVMLGEKTKWNYWRSGLPGGKILKSNKFPWFKYEGNQTKFDNSITASIPASQVRWPSGLDRIRGLFGQRIIK